MFEVVHIPALASAAILASFAVLIWSTLPVCARLVLAAATAFAIGGIHHPGESVDDLVATTPDGVSYLVAAARVTGGAAALAAVALLARRSGLSSR